jgi:hypothetical protein
MNEATFRREIYQMLRYRYGLWPQHIPDVVGSKRPGVPDLIVMNPKGPGYYMEVKHLDVSKETSFSFDNIEQSQRRWLTEWEAVRPMGSYLAIGVSGIEKRELYIVWWQQWLAIERVMSEWQNSLPYKVGSGFRKELQELKYDFGKFITANKCRMYSPKSRIGSESGWRLPKPLLWDMELRNE